MARRARSVGFSSRNLAIQGFQLSLGDARRLGAALRLATGACLATPIAALALRSVWLLVVLAGVSAVGGVASRHPFDLVWEHGIRHLLLAPALPPNPPRRRRAWRIAAVVLASDALLMAVGATAAAISLGALQLLGLATATGFNLCIPSELTAWRERRRRRDLTLEPQKKTR
jgi:hypothetical protein